MANIKSQKKRNRTNAKAAARNKAMRSELKTRVKRAEWAAVDGTEDAEEALITAQKRLAKAASKGVIHENQAARRTSRLMRQANAAAAG